MDSNRISYFDYLNVFSCFSVIALQCNGIFHTYTRDGLWIFSTIIQVLLYCAVPIFFMLSGATLLEYRKRYSTKEFYQKRIRKTVVPYLFFTVVLFYVLHIAIRYKKSGEVKYSVLEFLQMVIDGSVPHANFWFFVPLFMIYLFMPFLSSIATSTNKRKMIFFIGIMILFSSIYPILAECFDFKTITPPICGYALYAFLGYFLHKYDFERNNRILTTICIIGLISFVVRFVLLLQFADCRIDLLMSYFGLYAIVPSIALFMLFKRFLTNVKGEKIIVLSSLSFGVFLIQGFVIDEIQSILQRMNINAIFVQTIGIIIVYALCCCIVYIS